MDAGEWPDDRPHDEETDREDDGTAADEPHVVPIEDAIDLHAFAPRDVLGVVRDYLDAAVERGFAEVRVIHGRGTGFQRERVRELLASHPAVASFADAPASRGHWGATIVRLRVPPAAAR